MRIRTLLLGATALVGQMLSNGHNHVQLTAMDLLQNEPASPYWFGRGPRVKRSGKGSGGSLAHRKWRKRRSSGRA